MRIVVDRNIPFAASAFSKLGQVTLFETGRLTHVMLRDADALIVRSETKVDSSLLNGSSVRFVGTATIGTDHIDLPYLERRGIAFASAPGCNANSVSEYIVAALLHLGTLGNELQGKTLGVVGVGNVGSKVVKKAETLGMRVLQNDPPLQRQTGDKRFVSLDELMHADIITLHVPLAKSGEDATYHLFDLPRIRNMKKGSVLINTSRGAVVDSAALKSVLRDGHLSAALLDVWEGEPAIDEEMLALTALATPHIAGYSLDGKVTAVRMIYEALCAFLSTKAVWNPRSELPPVEIDRIALQRDPMAIPDVLRHVVAECYDIGRDDRRLRAMTALPQEQRAEYFRKLRTQYPVRREFFNTTVVLPGEDASLSSILRALGFQVEMRRTAESLQGSEHRSIASMAKR